MDWISENFQILALVGIALASWLKARMDAKAAKREEMEQREDDEQSDPAPENPWHEVFQMPKAPQPPPLFERAPPHITVVPSFEAEAELKRQAELAERLRQARAEKAVTSGGAAVTRARSIAKTASQPAKANNTSLRSMLYDRRMLRRAFVLREVLGPPLSMRENSPETRI